MDSGYALLIASVVPLAVAWDLSRRGLNDASAAVDTTKTVTEDLRHAVASSQETLAATPPEKASSLADANKAAVERAGALDTALGEVSSALAALTGRFAPARVAFAISFVLIVASLFALDVISITAADNAASTQSTTP